MRASRKRVYEKKRVLDEKTELIFNALTRSKLVKAPSTDPELIRAHIRNAIHRNLALNLVVFWGGSRQGRTKVAGTPERNALEIINRAREAIHRAGIRTSLHVLFMDTYSHHVNHRPESEITAYHRSMAHLAQEYGFTLTRTSDHYRYTPLPERATTPSQRKLARAAAEILKRVMSDERVKPHLEKLAQAHGAGSDALRKYIELHAYEDGLLPRRFPKAVFLSFGHSDIQKAISSLPTVFLYQQRENGKPGLKGVPWFREHDEQAV